MQLVNEFSVPSDADSAFATLSDLERIAPCMPGAVLDEVRGEDYLGRVRVRVGPVGLSFAGTATVVEKDAAARRLVVRGAARDRGGQGGAEALITMTVRDDGTAGRERTSTVRVVTDLGLSGRVGQFGGAAVNQVSGRIISQFVERVDVLVRGGDVAAGAAETPGGTGREVPSLPAGPTRGDRSGQAAGALATVVAGVLLGVAIVRAVRAASGQV